MQLFSRITFLVFALIAITNSAYAVTVPYTFTSGTPAMASQVNANFQALSVGMPGYLGSATVPSTAPAGLTAGATFASFTITPASSGAAIISGTGTIQNTTTSGTIAIGVVVDGTVVEPSQTLSVTGATFAPFNVTIVVSNLGAGTHTIALKAINGTGGPYNVVGATLVGTIYH